MLYIYEPFDKELDGQEKNIVHDVFDTFIDIKGNWTDLDKKLLLEIDNATFSSDTEIIDRLGRTLTLDCISDGCKTALSIAHFPDKIIDTISCGRNARDAIIKNITNGKMLLHYNDVTIEAYPNQLIDVCVTDNLRIRTTDKLNFYLMSERGIDGLDHKYYADTSDLEA